MFILSQCVLISKFKRALNEIIRGLQKLASYSVLQDKTLVFINRLIFPMLFFFFHSWSRKNLLGTKESFSSINLILIDEKDKYNVYCINSLCF